MTARRRGAAAIPKEQTMNANENERKTIDAKDERLWAPNLHSAFSFLAILRLISALVNIQSDCDEAYNYWEPLHNLLYGHGFQTWEYSPVYALRSYLYLVVHGIVGKGAGLVLFGTSKLAFFFGLRTALGFFSALCEAMFYRGVVRAYGARTARYTLVLLAFNSGMFQASTAFLPSSFVMYMLMLFSSFWMTDTFFSTRALVAGITAVVCGWPYVGVMCVPFAIDAVVRFGIARPILTGIVVLGAIAGIEIVTNYYFYHKWLLPAVNIILYNVVSSGSELYGVEPWTYYVLNLGLNFNLALPLACLSIPLLCTLSLASVVFILPLYIWLAIMMVQPHKEERFLYPVYPYLCLAAAVTLNALVRTSRSSFWLHRIVRFSLPFVLGAYVALSSMRIFSITSQYGAPIKVYQHLSDLLESQEKPTLVCVGKEWHRFPSHFFLPDHARLGFLRSGFRGQLPTTFNTTFDIPEHMNDQNLEETSRYVALNACNYVVDRDVPKSMAHPDEPSFADDPAWKSVYAEPFLVAEASHRIARAFYIPLWSSSRIVFSNYTIYARIEG